MSCSALEGNVDSSINPKAATVWQVIEMVVIRPLLQQMSFVL